MSRSVVVLLSGGVDSLTAAAMAAADGLHIHALTVDYGQRHAAEITVAGRQAARLGVTQHQVVQVDLRVFGGSALTADLDLPDGRPAGAVPVTYVPARNTILLALALAWAETLDAPEIILGANAEDLTGYPDCRPAFIRAFQDLAQLATRTSTEQGDRLTIKAPLIGMTKAEVITMGSKLGLDYTDTVSCYRAETDTRACGHCDACQTRRTGFANAGLPDPTTYR